MTRQIGLTALYRQIRDRFRAAGLETPDLDARLLVAGATGLSQTVMVSDPDRIIDEVAASRSRAFANRRLRHEPVARILGEREFWGRRFVLSAATLEPRPDTETLVETAADYLHSSPDGNPTVLDIGTGSGILLCSILAECGRARGIGTDISFAALRTARQNAIHHGLEARCRFVCADYLEAIVGRFDLIVSNPPYIPSAEIAGLAPEVRCHDPLCALDGGIDGLDAYRALIADASRILGPGGCLVVEVGFDQADPVTELAQRAGFSDVRLVKDLAGHVRAIEAVLQGGDTP
ncbi:MAG: peptide chain release factor N(5)-glutamine methyltransferase [Pseudomonadota bacterium]